MAHDPRWLEKEAHASLAQEKYEDAYKLFKKAAEIYSGECNHKQASLCFTSAASCWAIKSGEKAFYNSAKSYEDASIEAEKSCDFEYASLLYRHAAICYERDMEFMSFSECFYRSKECYRKFLFLSMFSPGKIHNIASGSQDKGLLRRFFVWFALTFSYLLWGHGERPFRTLICGIGLIFASAFLYMHNGLIQNGALLKPDLFEGLYVSMITFTTVGYGDMTPFGFGKLIAMVEAFCGIFTVSIFTIGLSRKYLRL